MLYAMSSDARLSRVRILGRPGRCRHVCPLGALCRRRLRRDPARAPEHGDELPPEARSADAVQQEVDGVVDVRQQVEYGPHRALAQLRYRRHRSPLRARRDQEDGDRSRGYEEAERYRDEDGRHRIHLDGVAVRVEVLTSQVVRIENSQQDRDVATYEQRKRQQAEHGEVDPRPDVAHESLVSCVYRRADSGVKGGEPHVHVLLRPEEMGVQASENDRSDDHGCDSIRSCAQ